MLKIVMEPKTTKRPPSYSKGIIKFLMILLIEIVLYAEIAMWWKDDLSGLVVLISTIAAACIAAVVQYLWKSTKENTTGGIVYETALREQDEKGVGQDESKVDPAY